MAFGDEVVLDDFVHGLLWHMQWVVFLVGPAEEDPGGSGRRPAGPRSSALPVVVPAVAPPVVPPPRSLRHLPFWPRQCALFLSLSLNMAFQLSDSEE